MEKSTVVDLYRAILQRPPENESVIRAYQGLGSVEEAARSLLSSNEYVSRLPYNFSKHDIIDRRGILSRHAADDRAFRPGHITNFLGVQTNVKYCGWTVEGVESGLPVPGNFHATEIEWGAALRAVDLARDAFAVVELGAGWGCWMINTAVAAKRLGKRVIALGVEGDEEHASWIAAHGELNGLEPTEVVTDRAVAWSSAGYAVFPRSADAANQYGQEPRFFPTDAEAAAFVSQSADAFDIVRAKTLEEIVADLDRVDLLHVDIQGGERALIPSSLAVLNEKVAYIVIGTHGRQIEGELITTLQAHGWILEIEEPCSIPTPLKNPGVAYVDGLQGWRNARIC